MKEQAESPLSLLGPPIRTLPPKLPLTSARPGIRIQWQPPAPNPPSFLFTSSSSQGQVWATQPDAPALPCPPPSHSHLTHPWVWRSFHQPCSALSRMEQERASRSPQRRLRTCGRGILESRDQSMDSGDRQEQAPGGRVPLALQIGYRGGAGRSATRRGQRRAIAGPEQGLPLPRSENDTALHSPSQPPRMVWGSPGPLPLSLSA